MKTKAQKQESLSKYKDKLSKSKITVFTSFASPGGGGLDVASMQQLRAALRDNDAEYVVEKKRLISKALKDSKKDTEVDQYEGSLGTVFGYGDEVAPAKTVYEFSKKNPMIKLFGGLFDGAYIDQARVLTLAKLPTHDVLIGQLVGMVSYPLRGLVTVLNSNLRNLVVVLDQVARAKPTK